MLLPLLVNESGSVIHSFGVLHMSVWFFSGSNFRVLMCEDLWIEMFLFGVYQGEA